MAAEDQGSRNVIKVSDTTVTVGQTVEIAARRFKDSVRFDLQEGAVALGVVTADNAGIAKLTFTVPGLPLGDQRLDAVGTSADGGNLRLSTTLRVLERDDGVKGAGSAVDSKGVGDVPVVALAVVAVIVGALVVAGLVRRRRMED